MASAANAKAPREALAAPGPGKSPATNSHLSSRPATKKQIASKPSPAQRMRRQVEVRKVRPELVSRYSFGCVA
jgi:hypothetical protein